MKIGVIFYVRWVIMWRLIIRLLVIIYNGLNKNWMLFVDNKDFLDL